MKKLCTFLLILAVLLSMPISAFALDVKDSFEDYYDHEETGVTIPYRLVVPDFYDERYQFPLVVFFHGAGERGYENERQLDNCVQHIADNFPKALILVPQCTHSNQWVDTPWSDGCYSTDEVPESDEMMAVMDLLAQIMEEYSVDRDCVYATGISMGGFAVWDAMVRHNDIFAAGVAVCGGGDPSKAELLKDTPMFVYHGTADETVPPAGSADMVAAIEAAGGTKVSYTEFYGSGHGIWDTVFRQADLYKELKKCKLSDRIVPQAEPEFDMMPYMIYGGAGLAVIVIAVILILVVKRKKKKPQE